MERPQAEWLIEFLEKAGKLKSVPRHCITPEGVRETVAGHCWRVSLMAWLLKEELPDVDMEKVIHMCLLHDLGEAVTGDIPAFEKRNRIAAWSEKPWADCFRCFRAKPVKRRKCFCRDECARDR